MVSPVLTVAQGRARTTAAPSSNLPPESHRVCFYSASSKVLRHFCLFPPYLAVPKGHSWQHLGDHVWCQVLNWDHSGHVQGHVPYPRCCLSGSDFVFFSPMTRVSCKADSFMNRTDGTSTPTPPSDPDHSACLVLSTSSSRVTSDLTWIWCSIRSVSSRAGIGGSGWGRGSYRLW